MRGKLWFTTAEIAESVSDSGSAGKYCSKCVKRIIRALGLVCRERAQRASPERKHPSALRLPADHHAIEAFLAATPRALGHIAAHADDLHGNGNAHVSVPEWS